MIIKVPLIVIEELAKKEENLGYYIELGRGAIKRADNSSYNKQYFDNYAIDINTIPTGLTTSIKKLWEKDSKQVEHKNDEVQNEYNKQLSDLKEIEKKITVKAKKIRRAKSLDDACLLLNQLFRNELKDNGWIYRKDMTSEKHYPFLVKKIYIKDDRYDGRRRWIEIELVQNSKHKTESTTIAIDSEELKTHKSSVVDVIRANNILFETDELKKEYSDYIQDFYNKELTQNTQYTNKNNIRLINDNVYKMENTKGVFREKLSYFRLHNLFKV